MKSFTCVLKVLKPLACIVEDKDNDCVRHYHDDGDDAYASTTAYSTGRNNTTDADADADADAYTTACSMDRKLTSRGSCKCRDKSRCKCGYTRK